MDLVKTATEMLGSRREYLDKVRAQLTRWRDDFNELREMPVLTINLMLKRTVDNDPYYRDLTVSWHAEATARHPKLKLIRNLEWGAAVAILPRTHEEYFMYIEAAARRNFKKAQRANYTFSPFDTKDRMDDIREIRQSTDVRQGKVPEEMMFGDLQPAKDPKSRNHYHGYPYFGVFHENKLVAYSSCFVAGEICALEHILGHADYQSDGIVPMMLIGIAEDMYKNHPAVRYFMYGTYFGAAPKMRRFKKKFRFFPHRVFWKLDARETAE